MAGGGRDGEGDLGAKEEEREARPVLKFIELEEERRVRFCTGWRWLSRRGCMLQGICVEGTGVDERNRVSGICGIHGARKREDKREEVRDLTELACPINGRLRFCARKKGHGGRKGTRRLTGESARQ